MNIFDQVANNIKPKRTPIWIMRQAGRYLPEYREVRKKYNSFLKFCYSIDDAAEVTIQPLKRYDLDAAIIFSDILVIPDMLGINVQFTEKVGPQIFFKYQDLSPALNPQKLNAIQQAITKVSKFTTQNNKQLIGFVGAPFTLLYYTLESIKEQREENIKKLFEQESQLANELLEIYVIQAAILLSAQIEAGATLVKIFDSWAGLIPSDLLNKYSIEPIKKIVGLLRKSHPNIPIIIFPRLVGKDILRYANISNNIILALDEEADISRLVQVSKVPFQGNMANNTLFSDHAAIESQVMKIMKAFKNHPHIFNLGHGILPQTSPEAVEYLIKCIRSYE